MSLDPKYLELQEELERWGSRYENFTFNEKFKQWVIGILIFIAKILLYKI